MKPTLLQGLTFSFRRLVQPAHTVPSLLPEAPEFQVMPRVLATGFMVGMVEWACIVALRPHLDWPREQSLGVHVDLSHAAATPPGLSLEISGRLELIEGRRLTFAIQAHDGLDEVCRGTHQRFVVDRERFMTGALKKATRAGHDHGGQRPAA